MKLLVPFFVTSAVALGLDSKSSAPGLEKNIAAIKSAFGDLKSAVSSYDGAANVSAVQSASSAVASALQKGSQEISDLADLSKADAQALTQSFQDIGRSAQTAIEALRQKKKAFVSSGEGAIVYDSLVEQQSAMREYSQALTEKAPEEVRLQFRKLSSLAADRFAQLVVAFRGMGPEAKHHVGLRRDLPRKERPASVGQIADGQVQVYGGGYTVTHYGSPTAFGSLPPQTLGSMPPMTYGSPMGSPMASLMAPTTLGPQPTTYSKYTPKVTLTPASEPAPTTSQPAVYTGAASSVAAGFGVLAVAAMAAVVAL